MSWQETWIERFYRSRPGWQDGTTQFHGLCDKHIHSGARILEVGAGPTNRTSAFLSGLGELHGVDISDEVKCNVHLTTASLIQDGRYPHPDNSFDAVVSDYVVEHVTDPEVHLREIFRVLKAGGHYLFRTPNLSHYVALVSFMTPHRFHLLVANPLRNRPRDAHDPWPTVYAMNTATAVRRSAARVGFNIRLLDRVEKEPSYGMYARPLFLLFMGYERLVNASPKLAALRANLFVVLQKPEP